jgi:hypothetical protein
VPAHTILLMLCPWQTPTLSPANATAAMLNASGSEGSHRGPSPHSKCAACAITGPHAEWLAGGAAQRWCTLISVTITPATLVQRVLQECWGSAHRWLTSISASMESKLSGTGDCELRGVVRPLDFVYGHLALLALPSV